MYPERMERRKSGQKHTCWALVESIRTVRGSGHRAVSYLAKLKESERNGRAQLARQLTGRGRPPPAWR